MEEKFFFNQGGVSVSNARFMVRGQTYAMNGVTSVKQSVRHPSRLLPIVLGILGLILLFGGSSGVMWGLIALSIAALWWFSQKSEWIVVLNSASGETQALTSKDRRYIDGVIEALNQSIIHRG
ncbi:DUF6232 family protein [Oleiagrimonas soli]|uniref:QacE n=1 Tax=Oleiagrimonas soli TaxID=1543381 RepID=A0A099D1P7_9GAMM|nr:DUF6232 family protein [Oleiagrimonas soli]KGI79240.1 QacE [Oleiagrimonas soli]MBB6184867.1 hypothetical protein [Oleiagrimonas soli]